MYVNDGINASDHGIIQMTLCIILHSRIKVDSLMLRRELKNVVLHQEKYVFTPKCKELKIVKG